MLAILIAGLLVGSLSTAFGADVARTEGWVRPLLAPGTDAITWTEVAASPTATGRSAVGWIGDYVYVFGNESNPDVALYWHIPSETWGNSTLCPAGASDNWTGVVLGGELYVIGRYAVGPNTPTNEFWKFTPDGTGGGTWTGLASYPTTTCMLAAAGDEVNGLIYAAGGYDGSSGTNAAYVYDVAGDSWATIASMPAARLCVGGAVLNEKFYVVGGLDSPGYTYTNTLYGYDPGTGTWTPLADLPQAVAFNWSSVTVVGCYIYQVGGGGGYASWPAVDAVQRYCPAGDTWFLETSLPAANGTNSALYVGAPGDPYLLSTGGWDGSGYIGQTFKGTGLPVSAVTLVTGGGWIVGGATGPGIKRTFGFNSHSECGNIWGQLQFNDHATKMKVHSDTVKTVVIQPGDTIANFSGDCRVDGVSGYTFECEVMDRGEPGHYVDWFSIEISGPGGFNYSAGGFLGGGNIQIHESPRGHFSKGAFSKGGPEGNVQLYENSPNPFKRSTTIGYHVSSAVGGPQTAVNLSIYDLSGRVVATLVDGKVAAGSHRVTWETEGAPSGIYFYKLEAGDFRSTKKMVVLR